MKKSVKLLCCILAVVLVCGSVMATAGAVIRKPGMFLPPEKTETVEATETNVPYSEDAEIEPDCEYEEADEDIPEEEFCTEIYDLPDDAVIEDATEVDDGTEVVAETKTGEMATILIEFTTQKPTINKIGNLMDFFIYLFGLLFGK